MAVYDQLGLKPDPSKGAAQPAAWMLLWQPQHDCYAQAPDERCGSPSPPSLPACSQQSAGRLASLSSEGDGPAVPLLLRRQQRDWQCSPEMILLALAHAPRQA